MFKLENYITPLLLSYVDKYIKNFRPEDSQVSLWGGDASFHNLDLRLEVLEEELHLPFSFVSGHIHELLIHVPWTKLASEPITITINTIECILKVRSSDDGNAEMAHREHTKKAINKREEVEAPPGYMQSLLNKIVSNIKIFCNNLILKYVEEDIVLSMNVKLLTFESANEKWEPSYTDASSGQVMLRKLISVVDLTICLDKRNAAGKIDVYQEPVLYRCSLVMHMLRQYHTASVKRSSITRLDIYCSSMEFSMTQQQVPMLLRLVLLMYALQQRQLKPQSNNDTRRNSVPLDTTESLEISESWAGWAWSFVPSLLPISWDEDWDENNETMLAGHTVHIGFYIDFASLTFKVSESTNDRSGYYSQRKIKYVPLLTLRLQGVFMEFVLHGIKWFNCRMGVSQIVLLPVDYCSCGYPEVPEGMVPVEYCKVGLISMAHKMDSLFDPDAVENKGRNRVYNTAWDFHITTVTETSLLERTPAMALDYLYQLEVPDDISSERLSEFGSDLEYSNLFEQSLIRIVVGPLRLRVCSGFFHRFNSLKVAASAYDYQPYSIPQPDPALSELPPPCAEDFDALSDNIPPKTIQFTILAPIFEFQIMDHPYFEPTHQNLYSKRRKASTTAFSNANQHCDFLPKVTLECQCIDARISYPMYLRRLLQTVCQLPNPPQRMFDACHVVRNVKVMGLCSRLITAVNKHTIILSRCSASYNSKSIIKPDYWINPDIPHEEIVIESESITLTSTKPKLMLVAFIVDRLLQFDGQDTAGFLMNTTTLNDASRSLGLAYLEISLEEIRFKRVTTNSTTSIDASLGSIKSFVYEPVIETTECSATPKQLYSTKDIQQVLFMSGPELRKESDMSMTLPLLTAIIQYPLNPNCQPHPSIVSFNLQEIRVCVDPLLCRWFMYTTQTCFKSDFDPSQKRNYNMSEASGSIMETPRRLGTPHESIHSSSDKEHLFISTSNLKLKKKSTVDFQEKLYKFLSDWVSVWKTVMLNGEICHCVIYFPTESLSSFGTQGIDEAVEQTQKKQKPPEILVVTFPHVTITSASQRHGLSNYIISLPVKLPSMIWTNDKSNLPWNISLTEMSCYTHQNGKKLNFLKPFSLSATIGISAKTKTSTPPEKESITSQRSGASDPLGICIHVDSSHISLSLSEVQICLIAGILFGLTEVVTTLIPEQVNEYPLKTPDTVQSVLAWSTTSPPLLKESTLESASEKTPPISSLSESMESDNVKLTVWIQWTITRFTTKILSHDLKNFSPSDLTYLMRPNLKLVLEAEDIVSSLDFQNVYLKIKNKIATLNILHYNRKMGTKAWSSGRFLGIVMKSKDVEVTGERQEDVGFATVTITRASCQHTHALWGTFPKHKVKERKNTTESNFSSPPVSRYITEIVLTTQPIDFILPLSILRCFYMTLEPLLSLPSVSEEAKDSQHLLVVSNQNLPLIYVECRGLRIIIPSQELTNTGIEHDACMLQIESINLAPSAVNPICRSPCRPDIYQLAAQSRILNIPGSEVEDRQYELNIKDICLITGMWDDLHQILNVQATNLSRLRTMNENPALEWNNLDKNCFTINSQVVNFWSAVNKFDILVIVAPAMVYNTTTLICGHSIEINLESDVDTNLSITQIKLASALITEALYIICPLFSDEVIKRPIVKFPYPKFHPAVFDVQEEDVDSTGLTLDSGIDTSELQSMFSIKSKDIAADSSFTEIKHLLKCQSNDKVVFPRPPNPLPPPLHNIPMDILITGGKIRLCLYEIHKGAGKRSSLKHKDRRSKLKANDYDKGYEASEEGSIDEKTYKSEGNQYHPLLFMCVSQPNLFMSRYYLGRKLHLSCFDISVKISGPEYVPCTSTPTEDDYPINLLETLSGMPNPGTGIHPAFFTLKWSRGLGQPATVDINFARPTQILCSVTRWNHLLIIKDKVLYNYNTFFKYSSSTTLTSSTKKNNTNSLTTQKGNETYTKFKEIKNIFFKVSCLNVNLSQLVLVGKTENVPEVTLSISRLKNNFTITNRPERLINVVTFEGLTLGVVMDGVTRLLLNPWTFSIELTLSWESWQPIDSNPQIQVSVESDCIMLDVSPQQLKCVQAVTKDLAEFFSNITYKESSVDSDERISISRGVSVEKEQYYKDDLRAGAFQFVDSVTGNSDELPLPYQVMFWKKRILAMAWRYPQPRALTKVRVFPVPYKNTINNPEDANYQILCQLEYWSDCHSCYRPYLQFYLSENDSNNLILPENNLQYVASIWRVVLSMQKDSLQTFDGSQFFVSPRVLAACMRIDSYFNRNLVPDLSLVLDISTVNISLYTNFNKSIPLVMPRALKQYTCDLLFPKDICFASVTFEATKAYLATWNFHSAVFDITTAVKSSVLDYASLTQQAFVDPFALKLEANIARATNISFICKPIYVKFGPSIAHTLTVSGQMWEQSWAQKVEGDDVQELIIMTRYVICNNTNVNIRFGQASTDEDILLLPHNCHFYCWRSQKTKQMMRVGLEENGWLWSRAFQIDKEGTAAYQMANEERVILVVTVNNLSATQKQILLSGQLTICNMLLEHFELKVVLSVDKDKEREFKNTPSHIIPGKSTPPTLLINNCTSSNYHLRLRFFGLESAWSGDIPLKENPKCAQPWLVKVPLQERGQFLSIWCRIVTQSLTFGNQILAILWPLFMIRSNLPVMSKMHIETPTLGVNLEATIRGRGECQQLYCPGTIDHSHQLSFQFDGGTPMSNPYVPLNYSLVDQKDFFKRLENENIIETLKALTFFDDTDWPYLGDNLDGVDWIADNQPLTYVQVRYKNASEFSRALLVELLPWSLMVNTLGCPIAIIINEKELCRVSHYGIVTPPKLDETFHLGMGINSNWNISSPLQLAMSEWGTSFYMPKITGTIPLEGDIKTIVMCGKHICVATISSSFVNEIRLLRISSSHVLINNLAQQVHILCLAIEESADKACISDSFEKYSFTLAPNLDKNNVAIPIVQWYIVGKCDTNANFALYISVSVNMKCGWSCPIRVDKDLVRRSISVQTENQSIPIVVASQEYRGQIYLSLYNDLYPQMLIENRSGTALFFAQSTRNGQHSIIPDSEHFKWTCIIEDYRACYYTMPNYTEKFPDISQEKLCEQLIIACEPQINCEEYNWSYPINLYQSRDQLVYIPFHGDVKITIIKSVHTTFVIVDSATQVEISAKDIRVRLFMQESETNLQDVGCFPIDFAHSSHNTSNVSAISLQSSPTEDEPLTELANMQMLEAQTPSSTNLSPKSSTYGFKSLPPVQESIVQSIRPIEARIHSPESSCNIATSLITTTVPINTEYDLFKINALIKQITLTFLSDLSSISAEMNEVANLTCDDLVFVAKQNQYMDINFSIAAIQFDNQMYSKGDFDFPVVLIGQNVKPNQELGSFNTPILQWINAAQSDPLLKVQLKIETWKDLTRSCNVSQLRDVTINIRPLLIYVEDNYMMALMEYFSSFSPTNLVLRPKYCTKSSPSFNSSSVFIPYCITLGSRTIAHPLSLCNLTIEPITLLLSVHWSMKLYIALDQSPLQFNQFERKNLITTPYRLGHALTMHYVSGAIFGAGWVVGSLELLGSPGGLARAMGSGLRDFVNLPYEGLIQGPWAFLQGVTFGSASLMRHVTAGTLQSVTKLASSVARNLDRLTLDEEHLRRTEEQRRHRPSGVTEGFVQGLTGLGISLLGAVGGIAHHPLQSVMEDGASPRSFAAGVGLGLMGVFTKPLSGAADLVALTGQGLLHGAGWCLSPIARSQPLLHHIYSNPNSLVKYTWKFTEPLTQTNSLFVTDATWISDRQYEAVTLILTTEALVIVNSDEDVSQRIIALSELSTIDNTSDPTLLNLRLTPTVVIPKTRDESSVEMDPISRARVADYVRSTVGLLILPDDASPEHSAMGVSPCPSTPSIPGSLKEESMLSFYVNPQNRNYFLTILSLVKHQTQNYMFPIL